MYEALFTFLKERGKRVGNDGYIIQSLIDRHFSIGNTSPGPESGYEIVNVSRILLFLLVVDLGALWRTWPRVATKKASRGEG